MDLLDAFGIVAAEFARFDLFTKGWTFEWDRAKRRFGHCSYSKKLITMSEELSELNTVEQFTDTLRHEIAHAIVGPGHHHNRTWKFAAIQVGARPEACYDSSRVAKVKATWIGNCRDCGAEFTRHRFSRGMKYGLLHIRCKRKENSGSIVWRKNAENI